MQSQKNTLLLIAGEPSGDAHAAALIKELQTMRGGLSVFGIGGEALVATGMELLYHIKDMAFLGLSEVIKHLPFIRRVQNDLLERARKEKPSCAILVDYPGFNLRMARSLKKMGIPVVYYISPQLWAWGRGRVKKIRRYVDKMLVVFPFEVDFYRQYGIEAVYVGHPLADKHAGRVPQEPKSVDPRNITIGLLPGSRKQEVESLLPDMVRAVRILYEEQKIKRAQIVKVEHLPEELYAGCLAASDSFIGITEEALHQCLPRYDAVFVASGTATLETGYYGVPMVVVYKVNKLTYFLAKRLVKLDSIALVNIVAGSKVAPELIQDAFTPQIAARELEIMLIPEKNREIRENLLIIREKLGETGASRRAATEVNTFIQNV
ncbi:MAG TPA: lipid-A-disaccharide synthase [Caldithrix abyssi]|uniref:Lipid-A-disaccharide synthase n=1 Tax=Caldithrix abyssi TaxID=187145 RepID=A0A7V4WXE3_CALAY|nr:lipid-A-disaccharide synthase [Caldithrix abyssi]